MKKLIKIQVILLLCFYASNIFAGNNLNKKYLVYESSFTKSISKSKKYDITKGGFFLNVGGVIPSKNYFMPKSIDNDTEFRFGKGPNLEVGNMFKIVELDKNMVLGLRATWLCASYTSYKESLIDTSYGGAVNGGDTVYNNTYRYDALQGSVRIGPYFTYAISDEMAIDAYGQIAYTILWGLSDLANFAMGETNSIGASFRFNIFTLGLDYNFGSVKDDDANWLAEQEDLTSSEINDFYKYRTNHLRIYLGIKF